MLRRPTGLLPLLLLTACSSGFDSKLLKLKYQPPRGVSFVDEAAGPPAAAHFSGGLELLSVDGAPMEIDERGLEALLPKIFAGARLAPLQGMISAKLGSIPLGPVARYTFKEGDVRSLLYFVPAGSRWLVVKLTASEGRYGSLEALVERSLSTLKLHD